MSDLWIPTPNEVAALRRVLEQQEARIAELEAQLVATRWEPVPDGVYHDDARLQYVRVQGKTLTTYYGYDTGCLVELADGYALCRLAGEGGNE